MAWQIDDIALFPQWLERIVDWHHQEWLEKGQWQHLGPTQLAKSRQDRRAAMDDHLAGGTVPCTFVAHERGQPLGTVSLVQFRLGSNEVVGLWLANMFVVPKARGRGVGASLLSYLQAWSDANNLGVLKLYTFDAADYYTRRGWLYQHSAALHGKVVDVLKRAPKCDP